MVLNISMAENLLVALRLKGLGFLLTSGLSYIFHSLNSARSIVDLGSGKLRFPPVRQSTASIQEFPYLDISKATMLLIIARPAAMTFGFPTGKISAVPCPDTLNQIVGKCSNLAENCLQILHYPLLKQD